MIWFLIRSTLMLLLLFFIVMALGSILVSHIADIYTALSVVGL